MWHTGPQGNTIYFQFEVCLSNHTSLSFSLVHQSANRSTGMWSGCIKVEYCCFEYVVDI